MPQDLKQVVSKVARQKEEEKKRQSEQSQIIVFELDKEEYGLTITDAREILTMSEVTVVPNTPDFIKGILNVRGTIVVVIDLEKRFKLKREHKSQAKHIVLIDVEDSTFGVIVDRVIEVLRIDGDQVRQAPDLVSSKIHADYLSGVVVLDKDSADKKKDKDKEKDDNKSKESRLIILLDIKKLLQSKELLQLGSTIQELTKK